MIRGVGLSTTPRSSATGGRGWQWMIAIRLPWIAYTPASRAARVTPISGSEITLTDGSRLPLLVEDREGYQNLCHLITRMKLGAAKGSAAVTLAELAPYAAGLVCLTGGAYGPLALRLDAGDVAV